MPRGRPPGHSNRYRAIAAELEQKLSSNEWPVGKALPSSRQLAQAYGVGDQLIRLALKELAAAGRIIMRPRQAPIAALGTPLKQLFQGAVGVVVSHRLEALLHEGARLEVLRGLSKSISNKGWPLVLLHDRNRWRTDYPAGLADLPLSGVVLLGQFPIQTIARYDSMKLPVVLVDSPVEARGIHAVLVDNYAAAFEATAKLIAMGRRRIAFLRGIIDSLKILDPDGKERQAGFVDACQKAGLPPSDYRIFTTLGSSGKNCAEVVKEIIQTQPSYTGVLCSTPAYAKQIEYIGTLSGLHIPHDLSVAVFSAKEDTHFSGPKIDFSAMGRAAGEMLLKPPPLPQRIRMPAPWFEGRTTAPLQPRS